MAQTDRNIPTLDGWRAIAILLVMTCHGYPGLLRSLGWSAPDSPLESAGILGVEVFFALSGYLITTKLLEEEQRTGRIDLQSFYLRRAFRIIPAALVLVIVAALLSSSGILPAITAGRLLSAAMFFANYSDAVPSYYVAHFWSLAVEEHFYLVWPALFVLCAKQYRLKVVIVSALAIALWRAVSWKFQITTADSAKYFGRTDVIADSIIWGAAVALAASNPPTERILRYVARPLPWCALIALTALASLYQAQDWKFKLGLFSLCRITVPLVIYGTVINYKAAFGRFLDSALLRTIGRLSYSLYLWQQLFLVISVSDLATGWFGALQIFPLNVIMSFTCAFVSYRYIEQPLIKFGRRLIALRASSAATNLPV